MPTYQYACKDCGHQFEIVQSFSDSSLTECPECHGTLRKQFGAVGVIFKGSGFYRNDSRSNAKSSTAPKAEKTSADKGASKTETASTAKTSDSTTTSSTAAKSTTASTPAAS